MSSSIDNGSSLPLNVARAADIAIDSTPRPSGAAIPTDVRPLRILMLGPALEVMGGVSSVERLTLGRLPASVHAEHVPTVVDGDKLAKTWTFMRAAWRFNRRLAQRPDLVHIHFASRASSVRKELFARLALRRGIPVIMHAHGAEYRMYWAEMNARQRRRTLWILQRVSALVVLGDAWREFFTSIGVPAENIVVLRNPVQLPVELPVRDTRGVVRLTYLGIVSRRKGAFDLLEAVRRLPASVRARLHLVLAGNGRIEEARDEVKRHGLQACIDVRGWLNAVERDALLAQSHAFVLPSYNEGLPMAMLEAMAWGLAPICTPVGSIAEVLRDNENGLLVAPGHVESLALAIERVVANAAERERLAAQARRTVEPLGIDTYIERLVTLYRSVALRGR